MRVFSVPVSVPLLRTVIAALVDGRLVEGFEARSNPLNLARATLYLPTRRAGRPRERRVLVRAAGVDAQAVLDLRVHELPALVERAELLAQPVDGLARGERELAGQRMAAMDRALRNSPRKTCPAPRRCASAE